MSNYSKILIIRTSRSRLPSASPKANGGQVAQEPFYSLLLVISLFLNFLIWILLFVGLKQNSGPIILHYSAYLGADLIGFWPESFSLPLAGLFIIGLNGFLAWFLPEKRLQYFLISASLICQIFLLIGSISIIAING